MMNVACVNIEKSRILIVLWKKSKISNSPSKLNDIKMGFLFLALPCRDKDG